MYKPNEYKAELIKRYGQTAGCPLFDGVLSFKLPDWVWNGKDISAQVYCSMKSKFGSDALEYLSAIIKLGGAATDHEVKDKLRWALHIVSARRNDLKKLGIIESYPGEKKMGPFGQPNTVWHINFRNLKRIIEGEVL